MQDGLIERIKSRGYWRINFQPKKLIPEKLPLAQCKNFVEQNSVRLRGWDYPHIPVRSDDHGGQLPSGEFYEAWTNWWNHIEFWRMYRSRQYLHYLALREDWFEESDWARGLAEQVKPGQRLGTGGTIYQITEIFEFVSRLGRNDCYPDGVFVNISLENTKGRELWIDDPNRMSFSFPRQTGAERIEIRRELSTSDYVLNTSEMAISVIVELFDQFGWENVSTENIRRDQQTFLAGSKPT